MNLNTQWCAPGVSTQMGVSIRAYARTRGIWSGVIRPEGYTATLSLMPSFGACTKSCFVPRYRSVV